MGGAVGEHGLCPVRILVVVGVVVGHHLGIIRNIAEMFQNLVGEIVFVQKLMPVGQRVLAENAVQNQDKSFFVFIVGV